MIAMLLTDLLESIGHSICATVPTEAEAITATAAYKPDLIITDGNLRQGSGVEAIKTILRKGFVPHIFVTGDPYRLSAVPGSIIVQKPFTFQALIRAIDRAVQTLAPS